MAAVLSLLGTEALTSTSSASAAPATGPVGCGYGTGGAEAAELCWLDFSAYNDTTARSASGQNMSISLPGGYTVTFNVHTTTPAGYIDDPIHALATPTFGGAYLGNAAYTGIPGEAAFDAVSDETNGGYTVTLSDITVTDSAGADVHGFGMVAADAESTGVNPEPEALAFTSDADLNQINTVSSDSPVCGGGLTGVGTTSVDCTGATSTQGHAIFLQADSPTTISASGLEPSAYGAQGVAFAFVTSQLTLNKTVIGRENATDSFDTAIRSPEGTVVGSASTGTASTSTTGALTVLPLSAGNPYTLSEAATAGTGTNLNDYGQSWLCTNATAGSTTVLPFGSGTSKTVEPQPGDDITCTLTNRYPKVATLTKTGTDTANGSTASSATGATGTAGPGDTIDWALQYTNGTGAPATVNLTDPITGGQTYVPGSLQTPPNLSPQYSTDGGATYTAGTPPANADGVGATGTVPADATAASSPSFSSSAPSFTTPGGDGYTVEGYKNEILTVFHHNASASQIFCATLTNQLCPGWPAFSTNVAQPAGSALGSETPGAYTTAMHNGSFIANGNLYFATQDASPVGATNPVGIQCLNLTTNTSCGFTQLDADLYSGANSAGDLAGSGLPASNGNYYYFDDNGLLLCFNPATGACGSVSVSGGFPVDAAASVYPYSETFGPYVFSEYIDGNGQQVLACYDTATAALCPGYPFQTAPIAAGTEEAALLPVYAPAGAFTGVCLDEEFAFGPAARGKASATTRVGTPSPTRTRPRRSGTDLR